MILIILAIALIVMYLNNTRQFPFYLVLYFVFYDMFDGFYHENKMYAVLRYLVPLALIFGYSIKYNVFRKTSIIFVGLIGYILALWIINSGEQILTSRTVLSIIITLMMIPIGISLAEKAGAETNLGVGLITSFEKYNRLLLIAIPLYIFYANQVGIRGYYSDAFSTGFLITSRIYIIPIVVMLAIHYTLTNKYKNNFLKSVDIIFILINICILLVNTRRTALAMLVAAIIIYLIYNKRMILKMAVLLVALSGGLVLGYPLYEDRLTAQLEKRHRIQDLDNYGEEGRVLETFYIIEYHKKNRDIGELLCGVKLFDTHEFGEKYFGRGRPIHSDINMVFYSTGIIGLLSFFYFFYYYFFRRNQSISISNKQIYYPLLIMFLIVIIPGRFINTLTFAPLLMLLMTFLKYEVHLPEQTDIDTKEMTRSLEKNTITNSHPLAIG